MEQTSLKLPSQLVAVRTWVHCPFHTNIAWAIPPPVFSVHQMLAQKYFIFSLFTNVSRNSISSSRSSRVANVQRVEIVHVARFAQGLSQQPHRQKPKKELLRREAPMVRSQTQSSGPGLSTQTQGNISGPSLFLNFSFDQMGDCFKGSIYKRRFEYV